MITSHNIQELFSLFTSVCSVSGDTEELAQRLVDYGNSMGYTTGVDVLHSVAFLLGRHVKTPAVGQPNKIMVLAHMDTVGYIVSGIYGVDLELTTVGYPDEYERHNGNISTRNGTVSCIIERDEVDDEEEKYLAYALVDSKNSVSIGDYVCYAGDVSKSVRGKLRGPYMDNRAGIVSVLSAIKEIDTLPYPLHIVFSTMEEIDGGGAKAAIEKIKPSLIINIDVVPVSSRKELSSGVFISMSPFLDKGLSRYVASFASKYSVKNELSVVYPAYGSDIDTAYSLHGGIPCIEFGPPCLNIHTPYEEVATSSLISTAKLLKLLLLHLDELPYRR